jgi:flagellar hook-basal body complex protein FliE
VIPAISSAVHALGAQAQIGSIGAGPTALSGPGASGTDAVTGAGSGSFGSQLTSAIGALEKSQDIASTDAQGLATGTISDPTQAVTAVENATLSMDLAAQIQSKLTTAATTLFQTQM